jgi:hypothetical protein
MFIFKPVSIISQIICFEKWLYPQGNFRAFYEITFGRVEFFGVKFSDFNPAKSPAREISDMIGTGNFFIVENRVAILFNCISPDALVCFFILARTAYVFFIGAPILYTPKKALRDGLNFCEVARIGSCVAS